MHKFINLATKSGKIPCKGEKRPHTQQYRFPNCETFQIIIKFLIFTKMFCYYYHGLKKFAPHLHLDALLKSKKWQPISNNYLLIFFKCLTSSTFVNEHIDWPLSNAWMFLLLMHLPIDLFQDYELLFYWCACWTTFLKCVTSSFVDAFANQLLWSTWLPSSSELYWHSYNHSLVALKKPKYPSPRGHTYRPTNKHSLVAFKKPKYWSFVGTHVNLKVAIVFLMFINTYLLGTKKTLISFCNHFNPSLSNLLASSTKKCKHQSMFFLL